MISVTNNWKSTLGCYNIPDRDRLVPLSDIRIDYEQIDSSSQMSADVDVSDEETWSDAENVTDRSLLHDTEYATLEPNLWLLDGEYVNTPDSDSGWISEEISGSDGSFSTAPTITLSWDSLRTSSIPGLTITWSTAHDEWASEFTVTAYNGSSAVATKTFTGTAAEEQYTLQMTGYDSIEISISKWCLPYRRARIDTIVVGSVVKITRSELMSSSLDMSEDPLSLTLPSDSLEFTIKNLESEWNPDNPSGRYASLAERQEVIAYMAYKINGAMEWHKLRTCYLSEWDAPQNGVTASFTARSLIDFMEKSFDPGSISGYSYGDSISLKDLITEAFTQANLPLNSDGTVKWSVDSSLTTTVVIPYEEDGGTYEWDFDYTCAEVVQLAANAGKAIIHIDESGDISVEPQTNEISDYYIDPFVSYSQGEYTLTQPIKNVNVNKGMVTYIPTGASTGGVTQSIDNVLVQSSGVASDLAEWVGSLLAKRKSVSAEYRMDPRVQPGDIITNKNKFATNTVRITDLQIDFAGSFTGTYEGKVLKSIPNENLYGQIYSGEISANGEW